MKKFFTQKKHKEQTSHFHSDIFIRLKSIKSKQATFTHKKHKMQTSFVDAFKKRQKDKGFSFSQMLLKSTKSKQLNKRLSSQTFFKRMKMLSFLFAYVLCSFQTFFEHIKMLSFLFAYVLSSSQMHKVLNYSINLIYITTHNSKQWT